MKTNKLSKKEFEECVKKNKKKVFNRPLFPTREPFGKEFVDYSDQQFIDFIVEKLLPNGYDITEVSHDEYNIIVNNYRELKDIFPAGSDSIIRGIPPFKYQKNKKKKGKNIVKDY